ncbi:MAG: hypothetical protein ACLURV_11080 [Gallintestinimicrobium sp.]
MDALHEYVRRYRREITIPELVKEGSLCPHQDYVYFNYPTTAETKEIQNFEERSSQMLQSLMQDSQLLTVIETHKGLNGQISDDLLLDDPEYLEAILIYLQSKHTAFPARLQRLLGTKSCPPWARSGWNGFCRAFYTMTAIPICVIRFTGKC